MLKTALVVSVVSLASMVAAASAEACGYYAIYACAKSKNVGGPGYTVWTNDYANFRKGWYCNIGGPFDTKRDAQSQATRFGGYVKYSC